MDLIEVDPKLFVTCRLCLEDLGQFQIAPLVQEQIKYCFDIQVELFDGLPQLICVKCKNILQNFYNIKKTYTEKQINLKDKLLKKQEVCVEPQHDTVSSSQPAPETVEEEVKLKPKKRKRILESTSSSDSEFEKVPNITTTPPPIRTSICSRESVANGNDGKPVIDESEYQKRIVCMICNATRAHKKDMLYHLRTHNHLRARYKDIFNKPCIVKLEKYDANRNEIGFNHMVAHNVNKVVATTNEHYYILYTKNDSPINKKNLDFTKPTTLEVNLSQQGSDHKEENVIKPKQKKRRLLSRSSNETVVIETESNRVISDNEEDQLAAEDITEQAINKEQCINIDDSSDNDTDREQSDITQRIKQPVEAQLGDFKVIQGIISMCVTTFLKKTASSESDAFLNTQNKKMYKDLYSQLKHKVLSIGRKIINKQGFNCTGLLRYMEHKNLQIMWMIKALSYSNKDINYIRILTKLRGPEADDSAGWEKAPMYTPIEIETGGITLNIGETTENCTVTKLEISQQPEQKEQVALTSSDNNTNSSANESKKLLNANPVANPKQLPKKVVIGNESKPNKVLIQQTIPQSNTDDSSSFSMPIITSTTSLAVGSNTADNQGGKQNVTAPEITTPVVKETPAPRIKVKPVTELMSERALSSLSTEQASRVADSNMLTSRIDTVWPHQQGLYVSNITPSIQVADRQIQLVPSLNITPTYQVIPNSTTLTVQNQIANHQTQLVQVPSNNVTATYQATSSQSTSNVQRSTNRDAVILDSVELPRQKTESPFKYLKDILQIHNIVLLDPSETVNREFICLIKFKVSFEQDTTAEPVVICLTMLCRKNVFCIKVRDLNQMDIDIPNLTANWQWVILRSFSGNVASKMLNTAQKVSSETFEHTKKFCSVLNSIKCEKGS